MLAVTPFILHLTLHGFLGQRTGIFHSVQSSVFFLYTAFLFSLRLSNAYPHDTTEVFWMPVWSSFHSLWSDAEVAVSVWLCKILVVCGQTRTVLLAWVLSSVLHVNRFGKDSTFLQPLWVVWPSSIQRTSFLTATYGKTNSHVHLSILYKSRMVAK